MFQKKLTTRYCAQVFSSLKRAAAKRRLEGRIDKELFVSIVRQVGGEPQLLPYEVDFMERLFERVDRNGDDAVDTFDLSVALQFISDQSDKRLKLRACFRMFDLDDDGCLTHDQILKMYCTCRVQACVAIGDSKAYETDLAFNYELSLQEARRIFAVSMDRLRLGNRKNWDESAGLMSFEELWQGVFEG